MKTSLCFLGALTTMIGAGFGVGIASPEVYPPSKPVGLDAHETHAAASLLGQFRTSFSSWLWLRTDLYLHNGTEMRVLSEGEVSAGVKGVGGHDDGHDHLHDDSKIITVVPPKERDFRGVFGDIEREVKTYRSMEGHEHNDPKIALPLFRLMTLADPSFIPGWVVGATVIARERTDASTNLAINHLRTALEHNPQSVALRIELARFTIRLNGETSAALPYLEQAATLSETYYTKMDEDERDSVLDGFRWLALAYREQEQFAQAERAAARGLKLVPDDLVLKRLANPAPALLSNEDYEKWNEENGSGSASGQRVKI